MKISIGNQWVEQDPLSITCYLQILVLKNFFEFFTLKWLNFQIELLNHSARYWMRQTYSMNFANKTGLFVYLLATRFMFFWCNIWPTFRRLCWHATMGWNVFCISKKKKILDQGYWINYCLVFPQRGSCTFGVFHLSHFRLLKKSCKLWHRRIKPGSWQSQIGNRHFYHDDFHPCSLYYFLWKRSNWYQIFFGDHSYITSSHFWDFWTPLPSYVSMFLVLRISKNWHFLTPPPPLQVLT